MKLALEEEREAKILRKEGRVLPLSRPKPNNGQRDNGPGTKVEKGHLKARDIMPQVFG